MFMRVVLVLAAGLLVSGCAATRAAAPVERPALDVPPAPPRVIEPAPLPDVGAFEPVADLPPEKPALPVTRPKPVPGRETAGKDPQKPDAKPMDAAPPLEAATSVPPAQAPAAPPVLRTPATADAAAVERQIRETLARTQNALGLLNYERLNNDRKRAYGEALDFIASAEARIKSSNFELAKEFADKAEKLARELQGR